MNKAPNVSPTTPFDWWSTFFSGPALDFWRAVIPLEYTKKQASELHGVLEFNAGDRVLDVPCGNGRLTLELAAAGMRMTGVDLAREFLDEAVAEARKRGLNVDFQLRDMRELPATGEFDAAFCVGNSFGYLDHEGNKAFLRALAGALRPGGRLLIEYPMVAEAVLPRKPEREWYQSGGLLVLCERSYDVHRSRAESTYTFVQDGKSDTRRAAYQIYTCRELLLLLQAAGFVECRLLQNLNGPVPAEFELGAKVLYVIARRRLV